MRRALRAPEIPASRHFPLFDRQVRLSATIPDLAVLRDHYLPRRFDMHAMRQHAIRLLSMAEARNGGMIASVRRQIAAAPCQMSAGRPSSLSRKAASIADFANATRGLPASRSVHRCSHFVLNNRTAWADQVPTATPVADEMNRRFKLGLNNGELLFDGLSIAVGGEALRGAAELGAAAKTADAAETAYLDARPALKAYMDQPYQGPKGHHILGQRSELPPWFGGGPYPKEIMESPFNKIRETNMSNRDFYRNHVGVDKYYWGGSVRRQFGGGGWSGKALGWTDYGPVDRLRYGTAPPTKTIVGSGLVGGTTDAVWNGEDVQ